MRKILLSLAFGLTIISLSNIAWGQVVVEPAATLQLCPDNNFVDLDTILIRETNPADFTAGETGVTYILNLPAGFEFQSFTGIVEFFPADSFSNTSINVASSTATITYSIASGSNTNTDSILIRGLRVRTSVAAQGAANINRTGTATHNGNSAGDAQNHGTLSSGNALNGISLTPTDITCNGDGNGQIAVTVASGNAPYDYSIDFGVTFPFSATQITGLSAGGYFVTVRDALGCVANSSNVAVINEPSAIAESSVMHTDITCNGAGDGTITAVATGGTGQISYSINGIGGPYATNSGASIGSLSSGTYDIYFEDANGCQLDGTDITINEPAAITENPASSTDISCNGLTNGQLTANATGGTGVIRYSINGIAGSYFTVSGNPVSNLSDATYDIYFQDDNGCQLDGTDVTISEPALITEGSATRANVTCNGFNDGTITANASGGTGAITYSVNGISGPYSTPNGGTNTSLSPGAYSIYYQDANGCRIPGSSLVISEPPALAELSTSRTDISCNNANDGTITALAIGGTSPIFYSINGIGGPYSNANGSTVSALTGTTTYDIYFRDNNGCLENGTDRTVTNPAAINIPAPITANPPSTAGGSDGTIEFDVVTGGIPPFQYSINGGGTYQTSPLFDLISAGTYTLQVRDVNNCIEVLSPDIILNDPGNITGGAISFDGQIDTTVCNGALNTVEIQSDTIEPAAPGVAYQWQESSNGVAWTDISGEISASYSHPGPHTSRLFFRRKTTLSSDVAFSNTVEIKINNGDLVTISIVDTSICIEATNQTFSASPVPAGAATGVFTALAGLSDNNNGTAVFDPSGSGTGTFSIEYVYTNQFGCQSSNSRDITVNENNSANLTGPTNYVTTDPATALTGTPIGGIYGGPGVFGNQFFPSLTGAGSFSLTYTYEDANECIDVASLPVTVSTAGSGDILGEETAYCSDEALDTITGVPASGGTPVGFVSIPGLLTDEGDGVTAVINPNYPPGDYTLEYQYQLGFSVNSVFTTIRINTAPVAAITPNGSTTFCFDDDPRTINGIPSSGAIQDFSGQGIVNDFGGSAVFRADSAGVGTDVITYIYEDNNGCNDTATISMTVNALTPLSMSFGKSGSYCSNDPIDVITGSPLPNNTTTFATFSGPQLTNDTLGTVNFSPGIPSVGTNTFTYTFTNADGCTSSIDSTRRVVLQPDAIITGLDVDYCENNENDTLSGIPASGPGGTGVFIGLGAANGAVDPISGVLNVNPLDSLTNYQFAYVYTDTSGCVDSAIASTYINELPVLSLTIADTAFCVDAGNEEITGLPNNIGFDQTTFTGTGIVSQTGNEAVFSPSTAGIGTHEVKYIFTKFHPGNSCTDSVSQFLTVNPLPLVGFVFGDPVSGDTITDLRFCKNQDSILLLGNISGGTFFGVNNANVDGGSIPGQAVLNPLQTSLSGGTTKAVRYAYTDVNGCFNDITRSFEVNALPVNFDYASIPANQFDPNPNVINDFCTEDDSVILYRFYNGLPGNTGTGFFRINPPGNPFGGIFPTSSPDTVVFKSRLQSGQTYDIRYIYTDTVTGCTDSITRQVEIQAEPNLSVQLFNYPGSPILDSLTNDTIPICTNGDTLWFQGRESGTPISFSNTIFNDSTDNGSIGISINQLADTFYVFYPEQTDVLGLHTMQFNFTSNTGCKDKFNFSFNILDTPSLEILIDTTFLSSQIPIPQLCQSVDSLFFNATADRSGAGQLWISKKLPISPELDSDTLRDGTNDTLLIAFPNLMTNFNVSRNYFANYRYVESVSGESCVNQISREFTINAQPDENFISDRFPIPGQSLSYCEYFGLDTFTNFSPVANLDTIYFHGPGFVNLDSFRATLNPGVITPDTSDAGTSVNFWYVYTDNNQCTDSTFGTYVIHPKPDIEFVTRTDTIRNQFCRSSNAFVIIDETQLVGSLSGTTIRQFDGLPQAQTSANFQPISFPAAGPDTLRVTFTSAAGCVDIDSQVVYLYDDPEADFVAENFCISDPIQFRDSSTLSINPSNLPDSIVFWEWQLSPFASSNAQNPSYDYDTTSLGEGTYNIELVVRNTIGCEDDTDRNIFFGAPPLAEFTFDDFCAGRDIVFADASGNTDSVSAGDFKWTFSNFPFDSANAIDNIVNNGSFNYQFANPGAYAVKLDLNTSYGCKDDTLVRIDIKPIIDLSNGQVYTSDFASDTIEWRPMEIANGNSWEQAVPNTNMINGGPDSANQVVWITNADGNHALREKSYVEGPCFDFSLTQRPMIRFDYFADLNDNSGVVLQFSPDKGKKWYNVGDEDTGIEWYNESSIAGNPGEQTLGQVGWSKKNSGWLEARHSLDQLRNRPNPNLRLRFAIGADFVGNDPTRNGFALANIQISERDKLVLIEHFTNSGDANARQGDLDHNDLIASNNNRYDVLDIQYHTDFPNPDPINLDNSLEQGARSLFYGVSTVPRTVFEGNVFNNATSTWVAQSNILENDKHRLISQRILEDAKFDIDLNVTKNSGSLNGSAIFTANENLPAGREYTAFIAVIEKFIPTNAVSGGVVLQGVEFRNAFKKFLPRASGTNIKTLIGQGDSETVNFNWNYANVYNPDSIYVLAFIQDNVTREIYQVASDDTTNIWVPNSIDNSLASENPVEFKLYPNPSTGRAIISLNAASEEMEILTIYDQMGNLIVQEELLPGTKNALINLEGYAAGVYIVQLAHPQYGVSKSKLILSK